MKRITRYRVKNSYMMISMCVLFIMPIVCWVIGAHVLQLLSDSYNEKELALAGMSHEEFLNYLMPQRASWEMVIFWGFRYFPFILPIFPSLTVLKFITEKKGYFMNGVLRFHNARQQVRITGLWYAVMGGLTITIPFCLFFTVMSLIAKPQFQSIGGFTEIFPKGFYQKHSYLVFIIMSCTIYFLFGFVFAFFAYGVAMWKGQKAVVLFAPLILYTVSNHISSLFGGVLLLNICEVTNAYCSIYKPWVLLIPLMEIFLLSILLIESRFHLKRGWVL